MKQRKIRRILLAVECQPRRSDKSNHPTQIPYQRHTSQPDYASAFHEQLIAPSRSHEPKRRALLIFIDTRHFIEHRSLRDSTGSPSNRDVVRQPNGNSTRKSSHCLSYFLSRLEIRVSRSICRCLHRTMSRIYCISCYEQISTS